VATAKRAAIPTAVLQDVSVYPAAVTTDATDAINLLLVKKSGKNVLNSTRD
jgi:hypothetical protein